MRVNFNRNLAGFLMTILIKPTLCSSSLTDFLTDYKWQVSIVIGGIILLLIQLVILVCLQRRQQIVQFQQHSIQEQDSVRHNNAGSGGITPQTNDDLGVKQSPRTQTKKKRRRKRDRLNNSTDINKSKQDIQTPQHQQSFDGSFEMQ